MVWELCDGKKNAKDISGELSKKLQSPVNEDMVWLALDQLKKANLIENETEIDSHFSGVSRRDVIRKIGYAAVVALPIVSSVTTATASSSSIAAPPYGGGSWVLPPKSMQIEIACFKLHSSCGANFQCCSGTACLSGKCCASWIPPTNQNLGVSGQRMYIPAYSWNAESLCKSSITRRKCCSGDTNYIGYISESGGQAGAYNNSAICDCK